MKQYLTQTFLFCVATISFYTFIQTINLAIYQPNAEVITMVVQATIAAQPTPTPIIVTIPVTVEITRIVALPKQGEPALSAQAQPAPTQTPVPLLHLTPWSAIDATMPTAVPLASAPDVAPLTVAPTVLAPPPSAVESADEVVQAAASACGAPTSAEYTLIPMEAANVNHPDYLHGDLNLALRSTQPGSAINEFVTYHGAVDAGAPQLTGVFADHRYGPITSVHQVRLALGLRRTWLCR
ncbi:MAG: hypothetical protein R3E79_43095 [Caldilineaceae bacterium]